MRREGRAKNSAGFEEVKSGNLERECIEESCDEGELEEVYDDPNHQMIPKYKQCKKLVLKVQNTAQNFPVKEVDDDALKDSFEFYQMSINYGREGGTRERF